MLATFAETYLLPENKKKDRLARLFVRLCLVTMITGVLAATLTYAYGYEQLAVGIYLGLLTMPVSLWLLRLGNTALPAAHYLTGNIMVQTLLFAAIPAVACVTMVAMAAAAALLGRRGGLFWMTFIVAYCLYIALTGQSELESAIGAVSILMAAIVFLVVLSSERSREIASIHAEVSSRQSDAQTTMLVNLARQHFDALVQIDNGAPVYASAGITELLGYSQEQFVNRPLSYYLHPDEQSAESLLAIGTSLQRAELRLRHADGRWIWVESYLGPDMTGHRTQRRNLVLRSYDAQKRAADQLVQAQRLDSMGTLAATVAHDFNNMLTVILGFADDLPEGEPKQEITRVARNAAHLTNQLLTFGHGQRSGREVLDLTDQLSQQAALTARSLDERYIVIESYHPEPLLVRIAPAHFDQVFINLLNNAREAMPYGGEVEISLYSTDVPAREGRDAGRYAVLEIGDSGVGMDDSIKQQAFDPFFSTKGAGGLGLSSCYGIVSQYNGYIEIDSAPGQGTTVKVFLPIAETEAREPVLELIDQDANIVVVDDDPGVLAVIKNALRRVGYRVRTFTEPEDAIQFFDRANVCLVITDVVMEGMNGTDLIERLREVESNLPVLFISGIAQEQNKAWPSNDKTLFLAKPFRGEEIVARSETLLRVAND